jgi:hypothetical protein
LGCNALSCCAGSCCLVVRWRSVLSRCVVPACVAPSRCVGLRCAAELRWVVMHCCVALSCNVSLRCVELCCCAGMCSVSSSCQKFSWLWDGCYARRGEVVLSVAGGCCGSSSRCVVLSCMALLCCVSLSCSVEACVVLLCGGVALLRCVGLCCIAAMRGCVAVWLCSPLMGVCCVALRWLPVLMIFVVHTTLVSCFAVLVRCVVLVSVHGRVAVCWFVALCMFVWCELLVVKGFLCRGTSVARGVVKLRLCAFGVCRFSLKSAVAALLCPTLLM